MYLLYAACLLYMKRQIIIFSSFSVSEWHENKHHMEHFTRTKRRLNESCQVIKDASMARRKYFLHTLDERIRAAIFIHHFHTKILHFVDS